MQSGFWLVLTEKSYSGFPVVNPAYEAAIIMDNMMYSNTIKENSEYRSIGKTPKKLLKQVSNIIQQRTIALLLMVILDRCKIVP